jgi:hypothetical protein
LCPNPAANAKTLFPFPSGEVIVAAAAPEDVIAIPPVRTSFLREEYGQIAG